MSVSVNNLTKIYGTQKAVNNISFEVKQGQIMGFLGPNGAGKTTTMKIITCFIPQSEGEVNVCGYDISKNPMEVRQHIGYLPEHNPLYLDMYVKEYLTFAAQLHKLGAKTKARVSDMIAITGLEREQKKKIGQLSKGYRQRVGLAQAMIHDPQVLVLDEPTSGLDPNQLAEIRNVIKTMGQEKTVILSTHIMQEVQALCDSVLIIDKGRLVAHDTAERLQALTADQTIITLELSEPISKEQLAAIAHIERVEPLGNNTWRLFSIASHDIRADIFKFAVAQNWVVLTLHKESGNLEDVFRELTSKN